MLWLIVQRNSLSLQQFPSFKVC